MGKVSVSARFRAPALHHQGGDRPQPSGPAWPESHRQTPASRSQEPIDSGQDRASVTGEGARWEQRRATNVANRPLFVANGPYKRETRRPRLAAYPSLGAAPHSKGAPM